MTDAKENVMRNSRMNWFAAAGLLAIATPALAKNVQLPDNVTVRPSDSWSGDYIDTITQEARGAPFAKLKLCLAQNISNAPVTITGGTSASWTTTSMRTQTSTIAGGDVFKYEDAAAATLIAVGTTDGGLSTLGLTRSVIHFELMAVATPERTTLRFSNIGRTDLNTGSVTNQGFSPVGAWKGAKPIAVIETLQALGNRVDACLR